MQEPEYKVYGKTSKEKKKQYWDAAIGLQQVDGITPSNYLLELAQNNIDGNLSYQEIETLLYSYYENETPKMRKERTKEGDLVSSRIAELLEGGAFPLKISSLVLIHKYLFHDLYPQAGQIRTCNIYKEEPILNGRTVKYADFRMICDTLEYDFAQEGKKSYKGCTKEEIVERIAEFTSSIWQVHPFMEGNTRTTAVFLATYLNQSGFSVNNDMFKEKSLYFRNALVRSNFADYPNGIMNTNMYLKQFLCNLLYHDTVPLRNRDLIVADYFNNDCKQHDEEMEQ